MGDVVILGNSSIQGYYPIRVRNLPGYIRGFDIRTGKQLWKFNMVPQPVSLVGHVDEWLEERTNATALPDGAPRHLGLRHDDDA